jgi:plasmid maintenance system antidote protein VapI
MILVKFKEYIEREGLKQKKIARDLNVTPQHLSAVINGNLPLSDKLEKEIRALVR